MRIPPFSITSLILVCVVAAIAAAFTLVETGRIKTFYEGDPERSGFKTNDKLKREIAELETSIATARNDVSTRERELWRLELALAAYRVDYARSDLLAAVALPDKPNATIQGTDVPLKDASWKLASDRAAAAGKRMDARRQTYETASRQSLPSLEDAIRARQDEIAALLKRLSDEDAQFQKDREELTKKLDEIAATKEKGEKQHRDDRSRRATKVAQLEDKIRSLLGLELQWVTELDADGTILEMAPNALVVDLGAREHLQPGALFTVFTHQKGHYVEKGRIEITSVDATIATARVISQVDSHRNPIGKGDAIGNPVYDARKPKTFVVAGEFKHYNKDDLERFITAAGGVVTQELGPGCDFLVAGDRSDREQANARQYQILAMKEDQLLQWVQPAFAPKPADTAKADAAHAK